MEGVGQSVGFIVSEFYSYCINVEIVGCKTRMKINSVEIVCETTSLTDIVSQVGDKTVSLSSVNSSTFNYVSYEWDFGDGNGSNEASPTHTYGDCGAYEVCLNVVDENGCCLLHIIFTILIFWLKSLPLVCQRFKE